MMPPIIDRELLFGNPEIAGAELSPDGRYLAFLKPWRDTRNIWVKQTGEPFSAARLMTTETKRPIPGFLWTRDGKRICYVKDNDGDENYNVYAVDPNGPVSAAGDAPAPRDLTGLKGVRVQLFSVPKNDPDVAFIGINDRDKARHDLYKLRISTGERTLMRHNTERVAGWIFDLQGNLRLAMRVDESGEQQLLRVDAGGLSKIFSCGLFDDCHPLRFHADGRRLYFETNKDLDLSALMLLDAATGELEQVEADPLGRVDFDSPVFSEATDELIATTYTDDRVRYYFRDRATEADYRWLEGRFEGREIELESRATDDRLWLVGAHGDTEPGEVYLFDRETRRLDFQYKLREKLPREALAPMECIRYPSSDGLEIPAYLTLPKGLPPQGLPLLVVVHGGPWARDEWGYHPLAQFFANRGYAVLMPNFRGSTGYGKKFLNAGNGEWGRKMQDDVTWGVGRLVDQGIADARRVGILGGSYGGYAALAGVAFTPDLYSAAVDIVGPSNLMTLLDSIPAYWESGRKIMYARMADPRIPEGRQWMEDRSPLHAAGCIRTPLMVVQGANDPRVNRAEAEQIVIALRDRGFAVEYLLAPDEGHGFARPVNNMALYMAAEKFLARHLGGRYQEGGAPEVVARLAEISVDPATVTLTRKIDAGAVGLPQPAARPRPGTLRYQAKLSMSGEEMTLTVATTIGERDGRWEAMEVAEGPMGEMKETAELDGASLAPRRRTIEQGLLAVELDYRDGRVTGKLNMSGEVHAIEADLGGATFAEGAARLVVAGCLPLADGYSATFRNFDLETLKLKLMRLTVEGSEMVTVPAGTFETFKVEIVSAEGGPDQTTAWIAKDTRQPVKYSAVLPSAGGAVLTGELTPATFA
jgi:dipeptidyl aminopeptidase/acylaminoacyl peptidase